MKRERAKVDGTPNPADVRAAGGLVRRRVRRGLGHTWEILLIHRPRYDDWSFPKGKRDGKETDEETALREVAEETGFHCSLGADLGIVGYRDAMGRNKAVHYWVMDLDEGETGEAFEPNREVDEIRWCAAKEADRLLTYEHDRVLIERLGKVRR